MDSDTNSYKVFLMKHDGDLLKIADVQTLGHSDEYNYRINIVECPFKSVNEFNYNLVRLIAKDCSSVTARIDRLNALPIIVKQSEDIEGEIFKILRYRRCTVYLVQQNSNKGKRYLAYFSDKIMHSAQCFGTDMYHVLKSEIIEEIKNYLKCCTEDVEKYFGI